MTLLEHFKDPYFWEIFLLDLGLATIGIIFLLLFIFVVGKLDQWSKQIESLIIEMKGGVI